jgi:signal transduction histidine kinase/CheY-like chemotaxis protein
MSLSATISLLMGKYFSHYFISPQEIPARVMVGSYDMGLVAVSYIIAAFGAFVALMLARNMLQARKKTTKYLLHIAAAFALGGGIWSMHFMGMLAYDMAMPVIYDKTLSILSLVLAIIVAYMVLYISHLPRLKLGGVLAAALLLGIAICGMHYMGMQAMIMAADVRYKPDIFMASVVIAVAAAAGALGIIFYLGQRADNWQAKCQRVAAAALIGLAVCGMHYVGMWAAVFTPNSEICAISLSEATHQKDNLALSVQLITGIIFALLLGLGLYRKEQDSLFRGRFADTFPTQLLYGALGLSVITLIWVGISLNQISGLLLAYVAQDKIMATANNFTRLLDKKALDIHAIPVILLGILALLGVIWFFAMRSLYRWKRELLLAKDLADKANKAKSDFLANMSHELRTPMNSVIGMTDLVLRDQQLNDEHRDILLLAKKAGHNLLDIVNDILDLSKIEAHGLVLENAPFELKAATKLVVDTMLPIASQKGLLLDYNFKDVDDQALVVIGDALRLSRVLTNLVSNAVKYTDKGQVSVNLSTHYVGDSYVELYCDVIDTGIGIPEHKLDLVFEKFSQADTSTTRRFGGTGLGLTITKQLVEMMGGRITVKSKVGHGSVFSVVLPYVIATPQEALQLQDTTMLKSQRQIGSLANFDPQTVRVLVAEDHQLNQVFVSKLLASFGLAHVQIVADGQAALAAYQTGNFDLILMDCHMPQMNGYDATRAIRALEEVSGQHIPIIAMTANAMIGDKEECLACGMDDYMSKPLDAVLFKIILSQWIKFDDLPDVTIAAENIAYADAPVNFNLLTQYTGGDQALLKEFIDIFITQSELQIDILQQNCIDGPNKAWVEAAHALKGGAANMGAEVLRLHCERAQKMVDSSAELRLQKTERLKAAYMAVKKYLTEHGYLQNNA